MSIMDFCAAKRPSELLARVKQRVAEKQGREKRSKEIISLRGMIKDLDTQIRALLLDYRSGEIGPERTEELQKELEDKLDQRDALKKTVEDLQAVEDQEVRDQKREKMAREMRGGGKTDGERGGIEGDKASLTPLDENEEQEKKGFKLGSSKDLLMEEIPSDPFAATAPRAVSPLPGSRKGKAKALVQAGKVRLHSSRFTFSRLADSCCSRHSLGDRVVTHLSTTLLKLPSDPTLLPLLRKTIPPPLLDPLLPLLIVPPNNESLLVLDCRLPASPFRNLHLPHRPIKKEDPKKITANTVVQPALPSSPSSTPKRQQTP